MHIHKIHRAFTIVELAVVILVLGILVSLSVFGYGAWRDNVAQTELKNDLNGVYAGMESAKNWGSGYPALVAGSIFDGNTATKGIFTQSKNVTLTYYEGDGKAYCIDAASLAKPAVVMFMRVENSKQELKQGTCALGEGGAPQVSGQPISWSGVANGGGHTVALAANGTVYAWGSNSYGQLGNGTTGSSSNPVAVTTVGTPMAGKKIVKVAAAHLSSYAIDNEGNVYSWGYNSWGYLGDNTTTNRLVPVAVTTAGTPMAGKKIVDIAASNVQDNSMNAHVLALSDDGNVYSWGSGDYGALGRGSTAISRVPVAVTTAGTPMAGKKIVRVAAGANYSLAVSDEGIVYSWGGGWGGAPVGKLGDGANTQRLVPVAVATAGTPMAGKRIVDIAAGGLASMALASDGTLFTWGRNYDGLLGLQTTVGPSSCGSYACSMVPVQVNISGSSLAGKQPTQIIATSSAFLVLDTEGNVHFWSSSQLVPASLIIPSGQQIRSIAGTTSDSVVGISRDRTIYSWEGVVSSSRSPVLLETVNYP